CVRSQLFVLFLSLFVLCLFCLFFLFFIIFSLFFFFNASSSSDIYTLSLHDALPILLIVPSVTLSPSFGINIFFSITLHTSFANLDRKSTRLNSSHGSISYAVFCLKKKK